MEERIKNEYNMTVEILNSDDTVFFKIGKHIIKMILKKSEDKRGKWELIRNFDEKTLEYGIREEGINYVKKEILEKLTENICKKAVMEELQSEKYWVCRWGENIYNIDKVGEIEYIIAKNTKLTDIKETLKEAMDEILGMIIFDEINEKIGLIYIDKEIMEQL